MPAPLCGAQTGYEPAVTLAQVAVPDSCICAQPVGGYVAPSKLSDQIELISSTLFLGAMPRLIALVV